MADKKMNDFATASDGAYIYAESASGEQIKISKADLASVVAGLYGLPKLKKSSSDMSGEIKGDGDLNTVVTPGCYHGSSAVDNLPEGFAGYWVMLVFTYVSQWSICLQLLSSSTPSKMYVRYRWLNQNFGSWREL